ncbi:MAG TPA: universal stress protein [Anaerolineales bacterium]
MFKHLLVPLDGSHLAESAVPVAAHLAQSLGSSVTLVHLIEQDAPKEIHKDRHLTNPEEAEVYLKEIASRAFSPETRVDWHVHTIQVKDVAAGIVDHTQEMGPDLIVMCTHGRGGVRDWLMGSIAQQVVATGTIPVLLIPAKDGSHAVFPCRLALVPLDGVTDHEQGIPVAVEFARSCGVALYLLMVVPTLSDLKAEKAATGRMLPGAMTAMLDLAEQGGKGYLAGHLERLRSMKITAAAEVARGDPQAVIENTVERVQADLIILGTHGKTGLDAFWSGSLTPRLSAHSQVPLLLIPVIEPEPV